jgi:hypothetical protein
MFMTRNGGPVELDDVEAVTLRPMTKPNPADDLTSADDRDQAARELRDWTRFPFTVEVERGDGQTVYLFGLEARDFVAAYWHVVAPWLKGTQ